MERTGFFSSVRTKISNALGNILGMEDGITVRELEEKLVNSTEFKHGKLVKTARVYGYDGKEYIVDAFNFTELFESKNLKVSSDEPFEAIRINGSDVAIVALEIENGQYFINLEGLLRFPINMFQDASYSEIGAVATFMNIEIITKEDLIISLTKPSI